MSPSMDFRNANAAGAPLPLMPRRSSSASRTPQHPFPFASASTTPKTSPPITLTVQHATPPDANDAPESSLSSSSSSDGRPTIAIRAKRVRGVRPPEQSTPTPTVFHARQQPPPPPEEDGDTTPRPTARPLVYAPGTGSLRALSASHLPSPSPPKLADDTETPRMVRKKSGQPVKSSLKSKSPAPRGALAVVLPGPGGAGSSKSAPSTPTATRSRVHFDTTEHVKLFLAAQRPLAVSRDGSPTEDTSGGEGSDFPEWIFGRERDEPLGRLEMAADVPSPPPGSELDVKLQTLALADDGASVNGTVAVRNLAFDKWVAVRFTFDAWQTTSEVTARFAHSLPGGAVDVFAFSVRLADLLARIEGKEMLLAVRYTSAGREMWDNNAGGNYRAVFRRVRDAEEGKGKEGKKGPEGEVAADLRSRLERVVKGQAGPGPVQLRPPTPDATERFKAGSLAARSIPWPRAPKTTARKARPALGSPRDAGDEAFRPAPYVASDSEDAPFALPPPATRHHQRGYFDVPLRDTAGVRRTPPGTPRTFSGELTPLGSASRCNSFPPLELPRFGLGPGIELTLTPRGLGELTPRGLARELSSAGSTPSIVSSAGSSPGGSEAVSPVSPPEFVGLGVGVPMQAGASPATYHSFLDRFCFYTGPEASLGIEGLPRTQSVSSVEEFLSTASASPRLHAFIQKQHHAPTPLRFDDSGTATPRPEGAATPIAAT
ncbi:putative phosphatase regulatory subunit-domain-containing protein [Mycena latifolia]|nr:putative phosphatase regulatory subunit-domain-containing protein [Mycena latifolia]